MNGQGVLTGRTALVTGASKVGGIGGAIAEKYAADGANLILTARSASVLQEVCGQRCMEAARSHGHSISVHTEQCDLSDPQSINQLAARVLDAYGGIDVLVANAGTLQGDSHVLTGSPDDWDATLAVNTMAPIRLTRLFAPEMVRQGRGNIVFTGSLAGYRPTSNSAYGTSKYAVRGYALACYEALREKGVTVTVIEPGYVNTPMVKDVPGDHTLFIQPEDVAEAAMLPFRLGDATPVEVVLRMVRPAEQ